MAYAYNLVGRKFGELTVVARAENQKGGHARWTCICSCGNETVAISSNLKSGVAWRCRECAHKASGAKARSGKLLSGAQWANILSGAHRRDIPVEISREYAEDLYVAQDGKCKLTGWPITLRPFQSYRNGYIPGTASLDRVDSKAAYMEGNVQWIHKDMQRMKMDFPEDRLYTICAAFIEHQEATKCLQN